MEKMISFKKQEEEMGVEKIQDFNMADVRLKDAWLLNAEQKDKE